MAVGLGFGVGRAHTCRIHRSPHPSKRRCKTHPAEVRVRVAEGDGGHCARPSHGGHVDDEARQLRGGHPEARVIHVERVEEPFLLF